MDVCVCSTPENFSVSHKFKAKDGYFIKEDVNLPLSKFDGYFIKEDVNLPLSKYF